MVSDIFAYKAHYVVNYVTHTSKQRKAQLYFVLHTVREELVRNPKPLANARKITVPSYQLLHIRSTNLPRWDNKLQRVMFENQVLALVKVRQGAS